MELKPSRFLTAEWRHLVMLNYEIDPDVLQPLVPAGTELDRWQGRTFVSMVGFQFLNTRLCGIAIPFHSNFEEVNLRFYVRRKTNDGWRRAVVFIKELVPKHAIAWIARAFYNENYVTLPMRHELRHGNEGMVQKVAYEWDFKGRKNRLELSIEGIPKAVQEGSSEEFITEHYWGYVRQRDGGTVEYQVEHPRWCVCSAQSSLFECEVEGLYGRNFVEFLQKPPASAFLADGSAVTVSKGSRLAL
ncbi:MAG: DUF2071 domain-containing protein [Methylacidiphilales bacterium]|nr:DUF2071 domain-containing protein [Candidatus Methylacidiphilales bacterium]